MAQTPVPRWVAGARDGSRHSWQFSVALAFLWAAGAGPLYQTPQQGSRRCFAQDSHFLSWAHLPGFGPRAYLTPASPLDQILCSVLQPPGGLTRKGAKAMMLRFSEFPAPSDGRSHDRCALPTKVDVLWAGALPNHTWARHIQFIVSSQAAAWVSATIDSWPFLTLAGFTDLCYRDLAICTPMADVMWSPQRLRKRLVINSLLKGRTEIRVWAQLCFTGSLFPSFLMYSAIWQASIDLMLSIKCYARY